MVGLSWKGMGVGKHGSCFFFFLKDKKKSSFGNAVMAVMKSPSREFGACLWGHQANLAAQQAKLDCFVYTLALLWLRVTHKYW